MAEAAIDQRALRKITNEWIQKKLKERTSEFSNQQSLKFFCGTWNVNNKTLLDTEPSLTNWLLTEVQEDIDVYCLGFQEIVELNPLNVAIDGSKSQQRSLYWQEKITDTLATKDGIPYTQIIASNMVGVLLCIYVKETLKPFIQDVQIEKAAVGALGVMANKCGISCSMRIFDTTVCVVCSHLAAKRDNVVGRNADFHDILQKTVFTAPFPTTPEPSSPSAATTAGTTNEHPPAAILDHDIVLWIGDLNYRIDESVSTDDVFQKVDEGDIGFLLEKDQLNLERVKGTVFKGFEEGKINFYPTYKFQQGTDVYEHRKEKKLRAPAWCDRVLWRCNVKREDVTLLYYGSAPLNPSDHKPVTAVLDAVFRQFDKEKESAVRKEIVRELDRLENGSAPHITLSWATKKQLEAAAAEGTDTLKQLEGEGMAACSADVGTVKFLEREEVVVKLKNIGQAPAKYFMVPRAGAGIDEDAEGGVSTAGAVSWLSVSPLMGMVMPEQASEITVTVTLDATTFRQLKPAAESSTDDAQKEVVRQVDEILILRIDKGRDFFIPISATFHIDPSLDVSEDLEADEGEEALPEQSRERTSSMSASGIARLSRTISTGPGNLLGRGLGIGSPSSKGLEPPAGVPEKFVSPLDSDDANNSTEEAIEGGLGEKIKGKALNAMHVIRDRTAELREKAAPILEQAKERNREVRAKAAQDFENLAEKATAGWQSFTSAVQKIKLPPPPKLKPMGSSSKQPAGSAATSTDESPAEKSPAPLDAEALSIGASASEKESDDGPTAKDDVEHV